MGLITSSETTGDTGRRSTSNQTRLRLALVDCLPSPPAHQPARTHITRPRHTHAHSPKPSNAFMPTLGFLKKKRTKDSSGSGKDKGGDTPTSPVKEAPNNFPPRNNLAPQSAGPAGNSQVAPSQQDLSTTGADAAAAAGAGAGDSSMATPSKNAPSIANLLNKPDDPAAAQNANGGAVTPGQADVKMGGQQQQQQASAGQPQLRTTKGKYNLQDFDFQRTLGTGSFGRVHLVQSKHNQRYYAVKVLKKAQVVKMKQVEHTNDERKMLQSVKQPFLITLWGTFQDSKNLYMVMDFVEGGELFSLLRKSQVRTPIMLDGSFSESPASPPRRRHANMSTALP